MTLRIRPFAAAVAACAVGLAGLAAVRPSAEAVTASATSTDGSTPEWWWKQFESGLDGMRAGRHVRIGRVTSPEAHRGSFSLEVKGSASGWQVREASPGESVQPGATYAFSAWARRVRGNPRVTMKVAWADGGGTVLRVDTVDTMTTTRSWQKLGGSEVAPKKAAAVRVRFTGNSLRPWQLDDVRGRLTSTSSSTTTTTTSAATATSSPTPTATPTATTSPTSTTTSTATSSPTPTTSPTATATPTAGTCTKPVFVTSDPDGMWSNGGYIVHNNMWNVSGYNVSEKLSACAYDSWNVTATADNSKGDGAVKTYPNVHKDFHDWSSGSEPKLSSFSSIRSTFAATSPHVGIYNVAYDIWLNGVPGNREIMIWTENHNQTPAGSVVAKGVDFGGVSWDVYATSDNGYIALVPAQPMTSGSLDLKAMLDWLTTKGRIPSSSTLGQICFGVEIVSTGGQPATFDFTDFSVTTS